MVLEEEDGIVDWRKDFMDFNKAPRPPITGTSPVPAFNERVEVDLFFFDEIETVLVMRLFSLNALLPSVFPKNPFGARDALAASWLTCFGEPRHNREDANMERQNELWADFRPKRNVRLKFEGKAERQRMSRRRNGAARGILNR